MEFVLLGVIAVVYVLAGPLVALILASGAKSRALEAAALAQRQAQVLATLQGRFERLQQQHDKLAGELRALRDGVVDLAEPAPAAAPDTAATAPMETHVPAGSATPARAATPAVAEPAPPPVPERPVPAAPPAVDVVITHAQPPATMPPPVFGRTSAFEPPEPAQPLTLEPMALEPVEATAVDDLAAAPFADRIPAEAMASENAAPQAPDLPPPPAAPARPLPPRHVMGEFRIPDDVAAAPRAARAQAGSDGPGLFERMLAAGREWLFGGNLVAKAGLVILFIGAAFLVRLAASRYTIPPEFWLAAIAAGAIGLLAFGWRIRESRRGIGLPVQGAALALLMLVTFGGFKFFHVMPAGATFALLLALVAFTCLLAVLQDALWLAVFGITGGFAVPVLTSTGGGSHVALFSYYALLNAGILAIALKRSWRALNLLGFAFTFLIGTAWGVQRYVPENYDSAQAFLVLFVVFYVAIAVLYAWRRAPQLKSYVDGALVFGVPMAATGLQYGMVKDVEYGMAFSALALGLFYAVLASLLWRWRRGNLRLLVEAFFAMAVVFGTLAIPLALDGRWTSAAWALEGAGIVWVGLRQRQPLAWRFGIAVQIGSWIAFMISLSGLRPVDVLTNNVGLGFGLLGVTGVFLALLLRQHARADDADAQRGSFGFLATGFIGVAVVWLLAGLWVEVWFRLDGAQRATLLVATALALVAGLHLLAKRAAWRVPDMLGGAVAALAGVTFFALVTRYMTWHNAVDYAATGLGELLRDGPLVGGLLLSGAALATSLAFNRPRADGETTNANGATLWWGLAVFWWCGFALHGLSHAVAWLTYGAADAEPWYRVHFFAAYAIGLALSAAAWTWIAQRRGLPQREQIVALFWPAVSAIAAFLYLQQVRGALGIDFMLRLDAVLPADWARVEPWRAFAGGPLFGGVLLCALAWLGAGLHRRMDAGDAAPRGIWLIGLGACAYAFVLDPLALFTARLAGGDVAAGVHAWQLGYPQTQLLWAAAAALACITFAARGRPALRWLVAPFVVLFAFGAVAVLGMLYTRAELPPPSTWIALAGAWLALAACMRGWQRAGWTLTETGLRALHGLRVIAPWAMLAPVVSLYAARWLFAADAVQDDGRWIVAGHWPDYLGAWASLAALFALLRQARADRWPLQPLGAWYLHALLPLAAGWAVLLALYWNLRQDGGMAPLPYLPVLNPLDLTTGFCALFAAAVWRANGERITVEQRRLGLQAAAWLGYLWFNLMLLRTAAAYLGLPYRFDALYGSQFVQAMLSLVWTLSAFALMRHAVRRLSKPLWMVGAAFLAVVVLKLFLVDLSNVGSVARIVSFMGVGGLMLLIGYLAPLPRAASPEAATAGGTA